ncbi:FTR1 family protein [Rhizobacter sp. LjRoot28]|uniref:FTR1 family protein n=1 Tax=Rhizobacter sp. LjRoot28 TaxID=3342309 RepID=UPI003ECEE403
MHSIFSRLVTTLFILFAGGVQAQAHEAAVRQLWQLIDYVGVDYSGAVESGKITSEAEYAEMLDFSQQARGQAAALPDHPARPQLIEAVSLLREAVVSKAEATRVADLARQANAQLLAAYPVSVSPKQAPELARGASLYQAQCASCHGPTGNGDGPLAASLDPKPIAFTDRERAASRSLMALYQVIGQGVSGTSMPAFQNLPDADRWALAWYAGTLSTDASMRERGAKLWSTDARARAAVQDLAALTTRTEVELAQSLGPVAARDVVAFLRHDASALAPSGAGGIVLARERLQQSLAAAGAGNAAEAMRLGLSAYLDGFEPLEPVLAARNKPLMIDIESAMLGYRAALSAGQLDEAQAAAERLDGLFSRAQSELQGGADATTTFVGALTILLREGLEALLIVVGMIAFLRKAERQDVLPHVHAGWVAALLAGGLTWGVATYVVGISGANREVTEGLSSLFAALVLLGVGLWMHQKSSAGRWQAYLRDKLSSALSRRSAWALSGLSFIAVYREVFETVLFFSALAVDGHRGALLGGLITGVVLLAVITWVLLRTSARMPLGKFFLASSVLVAVLAVVLAGKGVANLQEAGWLSAHPIAWPRIELLGMFPSAETMLAQGLVLVIALSGFMLNAWRARRPAL